MSRILINHTHPAELSTERAESSYGQPVLVIDGRAYGPGDNTPYGPASGLTIDPQDVDYEIVVRWRRLCASLGGGLPVVKLRRNNRYNQSLTVPQEADVPPGEYYVDVYTVGGRVVVRYTQA